MYKLTIEFKTKEDLIDFLAPQTITSDVAVEVTKPAKKPVKAKPEKAEPEKVEKDAHAAKLVAAEDPYKAVKSAATKLASSKGRQALLDALNAFDVANAKELKPEQYSDFIDACNKALE